jgi:DNA-binding MarR family transcriptional regulator
LLASIAWLENSEKLLNQATLSRHAHTDIMMTSQVLRTLEDKGFLIRTPHPTDTRAKVITLTEQGRTIAQQAMSVVESVDEAFFQVLGEQALTLVGLMQRLIRSHKAAQISPDDQ